jgi:phosphoribosylformylglycinamidine cyclo-ligase
MPGVYEPGAVDVVGTIVGLVERAQILDGSRIAPGDAVLGLPSSGLHTNGYSLARRVLDALDWDVYHDALGATPGEVLLAPHRCYLEPVARLKQAGVEVRGLAHITGGGVVDNLPRILPAGLGAHIWRGAWPEPPIFGLIQQLGNIADAEMFHVFNMGLGMLAVVPPEQVATAQAALPEGLHVVGEVVAGTQGVTLAAQP